jgi:hypothetical protein
VNDLGNDPSIEIRSCHGRRSLRFHSRCGDYFHASIEGDGPSASVRVWGYTDCHLLVDLFDSIARDWRGWQGLRSWSSIEGEFRIDASTDKAGHVTLSVVLAPCDGLDDWRLSVPIFTEAGQLEKIAREVACFFSGDANGPPATGAA